MPFGIDAAGEDAVVRYRGSAEASPTTLPLGAGVRCRRGADRSGFASASTVGGGMAGARRAIAAESGIPRARIVSIPCTNRVDPVIGRSSSTISTSRASMLVMMRFTTELVPSAWAGDDDEVGVDRGEGSGIAPARRQELGHELRAALFGIEASAQVLNRHREHLTDVQFDELTHAMVDEVRRVRALLARSTDAASSFDLAEAIGPVVTCARASGLVVTSSVPVGIEVEGRRDSTAQVVLALLDNVRRHAASSPVKVRATMLRGTAVMYVEDRGRGVCGLSSQRLFHRGVRGDDSSGSGLGLFIARRLMADQGGSIAVRSRVGGGASFVLRFRRASSIDAVSHEGTGVPVLTGR
jgi:signal transduction histidine kinase